MDLLSAAALFPAGLESTEPCSVLAAVLALLPHTSCSQVLLQLVPSSALLQPWMQA